jgi:5-methylcytosine-specific restriction protein A
MRPPGAPTKTETARLYDRRRDPRARKFYASAAWRRFRIWFLNAHPFCEECLKRDLLIGANEVHHKEGLGEDMELAFDDSKMAALCKPCHSSITIQEGRHRTHARENVSIDSQIPP